MRPFRNIREFISLLKNEGEIVEVNASVDANLEIAEIHRRVAAAEGPALFFKNVKGSRFPVVTNLFGSKRRVELCFGPRPEELLSKFIALSEHPPSLTTLWKHRKLFSRLRHLGTKRVKSPFVSQVKMNPIDLESLPLLKSWPMDGGHFVTLPLVYTQPIGGGPPNLGMYRIQRYDQKHCGLHFQIGKGGGFHYYEAEKQNRPLPVTIFIGGAPSLILSAIVPLPENISELLFASFLQEQKMGLSKEGLISECEFAIVGKAPPHKRKGEGPFGDHYGYYSLEHDFPYLECEAIYHRKDAIYPATIVGKPKQEDFYIGEYLQQLLSPLFPKVMPGVISLWSYGESGFHSLSAAIVKERYARESLSSAFRIFGEGQLSFTKTLLLTDQSVDLQNFRETLITVLERMQPERDLYIFSNLCLDTLDYTGPKLNEGSRALLIGIGEKIRDLPEKIHSLPSSIKRAQPFCPGCLVIEVIANTDCHALPEHPELATWPLIIVVDDLTKTLKNDLSFIWTTFTRFEPAADIYTKESAIKRHHICYSFPIVIDARMKPSYPPELFCDPETAMLVTKRWSEYFPYSLEMGDSDLAHL